MRLLRAAILFVGIIGAAVSWAHDPGISLAQGELRPGQLSLTTGFAPADAQTFLPLSDRRDSAWTPEDFEVVRERLLAVAPQLWEVRAGDAVVKPRDLRVELLPGDNVSFFLVFPLPVGVERLTLRAPKIPELPAGHRQFVMISDERGSALTRKLLNASDVTLNVPLGPLTAVNPNAPAAEPDPAEPPAFWSFVKLGVEHIWLGYDHLLFLFALIVVCRSFRSVVAIISCFTLAHSLTLALATFDLVSVPARWVEPAIAASIVFVGVENLLRKGEEPKGRWALTFVFGLIHGFGFASVLRDLGVGSAAQGIAMPLFAFNLGVEVGQIVIAALVLPVVWQLRKRDAFVRRGVPLLSVLVALAGLYWLLERTLFS